MEEYVNIDPNDIHDAEPELLWFDKYQSKRVRLDFDDAVIKAGSPISASGKVANDATAIGILKRDCYRHLTNVGDVIIGGYIKSDIAQSHSGIKISDAARAAMSRLAFIGADGVPDGHPQSDWNQNDDTQPDYVKNRPFYTGNPVETVLVEESTASFVSANGMHMSEFPSTFAATVGDTYKVYWDGTAYECTCVPYDNMPAIGNLSIAGDISDTGEPFVIMIADVNVIQIGTADASASHTISISQYVAGEVVKIDRKYIPKAAFITYDSSTSTYSSDFTNAELYERMLEGEQIVLYFPTNNECFYLTKWKKQSDGSVDLSFAVNAYSVSLLPDGTIVATTLS